jgi:hypothetical protein
MKRSVLAASKRVTKYFSNSNPVIGISPKILEKAAILVPVGTKRHVFVESGTFA